MTKIGNYKDAVKNEETAKKKYKGVMIAVPNYTGEIMQETHASLTVLIRFLEKNGIPSSEYLLSMAGPAEARNHILTRFYDDTDYEHLLMVDDDMQFMPNMVARALNLGKPIVGAVYHKRELPNPANPWASIVGTPEDGEQEIIDGFQKWKYVGGGVLLINRSVITKMLKKMPDLSDVAESTSNAKTGVTRLIRAFDEIKIDNANVMSEDTSFCERWRRCGGEIWAAIDFPVGHIGKFNFCINPAEHLRLRKPVEAKNAA